MTFLIIMQKTLKLLNKNQFIFKGMEIKQLSAEQQKYQKGIKEEIKIFTRFKFSHF